MAEAGFTTETIEHLGLVAGMINELGITELIDDVVPQDQSQRSVSVGQAVKAMLLNGLGFANRRLYLTPRFFRNKPVERLVGPGITAGMLNDDTLGRALDSLHEFGVTELFTLLSQQAAARLGLQSRTAHLDTTSFHVDGRYEKKDDGSGLTGVDGDACADDSDAVISLNRGYSRDHRPDLNQVVLELIVENQAAIPVLMKPLSGNASDKASFAEAITNHAEQLTAAGITTIILDSAGFTPATITALEAAGMRWVTSVPATNKIAKKLLHDPRVTSFEPLADGYEVKTVMTEYAGVKQRWLVIRSREARKRAASTAERQLLKLAEAERKKFDTLCREKYACKADALNALAGYRKTCKLLEVHNESASEMKHYQSRGRPGKNAVPNRITYTLAGDLATPAKIFSERVEHGSRFILATNDINEELSPAEILTEYKNQGKVERGFRFLKDPMFCADILYLKKPERITALLMIMTTCLLVYAALEYRIRQALQEAAATVPDQKGKPTSRPTTKWVFELFLDVHVLTINRGHPESLIMNLEEDLKGLLELLGPGYAKAYS